MKDGGELYYKNFDPKKYDKKKVTWKGKLFVKAKVFSFFHIPINFGNVVNKNIKKLEKASALPKDVMVLSDEKSLFYSNVYISTKKAIPNAKDVKVSGTFLTKVFEGPYSDMKKWMEEMEDYVKSKKQTLKHMYFYYTTCPADAKKLEKKYTVIFAEI